MRHKIPTRNWTGHFADAIEDSEVGDTIVCHTPEMADMAERARGRMCPDKILVFVVEAPEIV